MTMSSGMFVACFDIEMQPPPSPLAPPPSPVWNTGPPEELLTTVTPASALAAPASALEPHPCPARATAARPAARVKARIAPMPSGRLIALLIELASARKGAAASIWLSSGAPAARVGRARALSRGALEVLVAHAGR